MPKNNTDTNAVGTLITTEFGGPPNTPAFAEQLDGYKVSNVYPFVYEGETAPTDTTPQERAITFWEQEVAQLGDAFYEGEIVG